MLCADEEDAAADTISFCPTRMLLLVRLFQAFSCANVHPCLSAIFPSTSPLLTVYVVAFAGAGVLCEVADDDDADEAADAGALPPLYITSLCPTRMLLLERLFHLLICATVHLCLLAILPR